MAFHVCLRCGHVRMSGFCGACHRVTIPFRRRG